MKNLYFTPVIIFISLLFSTSLQAQYQARKNYRNGLNEEKKKHFTLAEREYRKSISIDSTMNYAYFGCGNVQYQQGKYKEALESYSKVSVQKSPLSQQEMADLFHNIGNTEMRLKDYAKAVEAFKQSLRLNPNDDETRYNLALAQKLMKKNNQNNSQNNNSSSQPQPNPPQQQQQQQTSENNTKNKSQMNPQTSKQILDSYKQDDEKTRKKYEQRTNEHKNDPNNKGKKQW